MKLKEKEIVLYTIWENILNKHTIEKGIIWQYFKKLNRYYSHTTRYYHNFTHLKSLFNLCYKFETQITDFETIALAIFYHDIIYNTNKTNNEEKSAELAQKHLFNLGFNPEQINRIKKYILATKNHNEVTLENDFDLLFFLDADLSILGSNQQEYSNYIKNIRKEYQRFPDEIYKAGRMAFLQKLLNQTTIYKTNLFKDQFEKVARNNIIFEIEYLSKR